MDERTWATTAWSEMVPCGECRSADRTLWRLQGVAGVTVGYLLVVRTGTRVDGLTTCWDADADGAPVDLTPLLREPRLMTDTEVAEALGLEYTEEVLDG